MTAVAADVGRSPLPYTRGVILVDRFILRRQLATGGSGDVWVASNRATGGAVAIKLVRTSSSALNAARFRQEAGLSAALVHRNIVRVFDFFDTNRGVLGLVMECLRGETARERLERAGPLSPRGAVALVTQALAGLAHAHAHAIVHRDIKPPNLFLATDPDGSTTTKILDFGVAHTPTNTVHTLHGQMLGTPRYMSPEQIRADGGIDGRSDIFSIAVVLYELITGRCPFEAPFPTASLAAVLEAKVERDERIPPALWEVMSRALSKNREGRPASAKEFADALRTAVEADDGGLARELHRSRPPPPLFAEEESNGAVVIVEPPPLEPPPDAHPRIPIRERAAKVVLATIAASFAILAAAGVRVAVRAGSSPPTPATVVASPPPQPASEPAPVATTVSFQSAAGTSAPTHAPDLPVPAAPEPAVRAADPIHHEATAEPTTRRSDSTPSEPVSAAHPAAPRHPPTHGAPKGSLVRDPGF